MILKIRVAAVFVLLVMLVSYATTSSSSPEGSSPLPEKYNLDDVLKPLNQLMKPKKSNFEEVDDQSIILKANRAEYYLLVLREPIDPYISKQRTIGFAIRGSSVQAGADRIYVDHSSGTMHYFIEKIYRLKGRKQAEEIKERLRQ